MFVLAEAMARNNHDHVTNIRHLLLIMRHEFTRVAASLSVLGYNAVAIYLNVHSLVHLVAHHSANQSTPWEITRRVVHKIPSRDGGRVSEILIRHAGDDIDRVFGYAWSG